jgi:hypothetical protein
MTVQIHNHVAKKSSRGVRWRTFDRPHPLHDIEPQPEAPSEAWERLHEGQQPDADWDNELRMEIQDAMRRFQRRKLRDCEALDPNIASGAVEDDETQTTAPTATGKGPPPGMSRFLSTSDINAANRRRHNRPTRDNPPPIKALVDLSAAWKRKYPRPRTAKDPNNGTANSFKNANRV